MASLPSIKTAVGLFRKRETFVSEYERWQVRFSEPGYAFGKEPNCFLKSCAQLLPRSGRALAIADGEGRNAIWLAEQGLEVLSIDFSPLAQPRLVLWRPKGESRSISN